MMFLAHVPIKKELALLSEKLPFIGTWARNIMNRFYLIPLKTTAVEYVPSFVA